MTQNTNPSSPTRLIVVIARAGSKGLPNKAMALLDGRPLIAWTLEHARASTLASGIIVSSDSPEIRQVGQQMGVDVCDRPSALASDQATIDSAVRHAVETWETRHGRSAAQVVILYGNIPLRPMDLVDRALGKLDQTGCDSVQSVYPVGKTHPFWMKKLAGPSQDVLEMYQPNDVYRRQDLPPVYMLDGGIIALTRQSLFNFDPEGREPHRFLGRDRRAIVTEPGDVVDVDTPLDLLLAETIHNYRKQSGSRT
jgi:CMP-N,N'-diacetyllegionaminic acid synthase